MTSDWFLACDWGTTHLRIQCVDRRGGSVAAELASADGAARLASEASGAARAARFCQTLAERIGELEIQAGRSLDSLPVIISGMASSSIGWQELPYADLPFRLDGTSATCRELPPSALVNWPARLGSVTLVSGVRSSCDVLRGEETQVLGLAELARREPERIALPSEAVVLLPGTHSKHLELSGGSLVDFHTYMTGELYAVLGTHSVLRHTVDLAWSSATDSPQSTAAFAEGVERGAAAGLSVGLFSVRTRQLLGGHTSLANAAFLSGLLIGDELAHLLATPAGKGPIVVLASGSLAAAYSRALDQLGAGERCSSLAAADVTRLSALGQIVLLRKQIAPQ